MLQLETSFIQTAAKEPEINWKIKCFTHIFMKLPFDNI